MPRLRRRGDREPDAPTHVRTQYQRTWNTSAVRGNRLESGCEILQCNEHGVNCHFGVRSPVARNVTHNRGLQGLLGRRPHAEDDTKRGPRKLAPRYSEPARTKSKIGHSAERALKGLSVQCPQSVPYNHTQPLICCHHCMHHSAIPRAGQDSEFGAS